MGGGRASKGIEGSGEGRGRWQKASHLLAGVHKGSGREGNSRLGAHALLPDAHPFHDLIDAAPKQRLALHASPAAEVRGSQRKERGRASQGEQRHGRAWTCWEGLNGRRRHLTCMSSAGAGAEGRDGEGGIDGPGKERECVGSWKDEAPS